MSRPYLITALVIGSVGLAALNVSLLSRPIDTSATQLPGGAIPLADIPDGGLRFALGNRTIKDFPETTARPLFRPSRRPTPVVPPAPTDAAPSRPTAEAVPPAELRLAGIMHGTDKQRRALVVWPLQPAGKWIEEGDEIDGWRLTRIERHVIRIEAGHRVHELKLP